MLAFYLADMEDRQLYQVSGHGSTVHFGDAQLELDARRVRELMQVGRSLRDLPLLDAAFREGRLTWSRILALLPVIQRETQTEWVEFAMRHSFRELRRSLAGCQPGDAPGDGDEYALVHQRICVQAKLDDSTYSMFEEARMRLSSGGRLLTDEEVIRELLRCVLYGDDPVPKKALPLNAARNDEEVPEEVRDHVLRRDRHRCRNCERPFDISVHHIEFRSFGGSNRASNLLTLCNTCHASVHRGFLRIEGDPETATLLFTSAGGFAVNRGERSLRPHSVVDRHSLRKNGSESPARPEDTAGSAPRTAPSIADPRARSRTRATSLT